MAAENAGTIAIQIRLKLDQMGKDSLDAQKAMDRLANKFKQQGQTAGKGFLDGIKQGFENVDASAVKLGKSITTKLSPVMLAIEAGTKVISGIGKAFGSALMANEKFAKGVSDLKASLGDSFASVVKPVSDFFAKDAGIKVISGIGKAFGSALMANEKFAISVSGLKASLGDSFASVVKPVSDFFANLIEKAAGGVKQTKEVQDALKRLKSGNAAQTDIDLGKNLETTRSQYDALLKKFEKTKKDLEQAEKTAKLQTSGVAEAAANGTKRRLEGEFETLKTALDEFKPILDDLENKKEKIKIERQALVNSESFKAQSIEAREQILSDFDKITDGMKKMQEDSKSGNWLANAMGLDDEQFGRMMQAGEATIGVFDNISGAMLKISRKHAEEQIANVEKVLEETLKNIEKAREAKLIAAGFDVENNAESLEAQLEAIKRTGDEVLIYQTERRLEEQRINDEFDAEAKAAQKQAAQEKAEIEYKLAKQEHAMQIIKAVNAGVMAVLQASNNMWPIPAIPMMAAAGIATAVQIGLLANNPPQPPKFANSGIVPGNKYFGDRNVAAVDSGELILNRVHQDKIADDLTSSGSVTATIFIMMDSREIAQSTINLVNDGKYTIKARAVK